MSTRSLDVHCLVRTLNPSLPLLVLHYPPLGPGSNLRGVLILPGTRLRLLLSVVLRCQRTYYLLCCDSAGQGFDSTLDMAYNSPKDVLSSPIIPRVSERAPFDSVEYLKLPTLIALAILHRFVLDLDGNGNLMLKDCTDTSGLEIKYPTVRLRLKLKPSLEILTAIKESACPVAVLNIQSQVKWPKELRDFLRGLVFRFGEEPRHNTDSKLFFNLYKTCRRFALAWAERWGQTMIFQGQAKY
ncbi:hypothetical protein B0H13DRAFT_1891922 [Mycena leptocephala]|nr:hypothetical protein B0H13DRAFT_1891922 [Mycena leptocephala]